MVNFFAYGTLQIPEVFRAVTGRRIGARPALLDGYARYRLTGLHYPGLIAQAGARTEGVLFRGLGAREMARLDRFEDDFYQRLTLPVTTGEAEVVHAEVYVIRAEWPGLIDARPWSLEAFRRDHLRAFMARCQAIDNVVWD